MQYEWLYALIILCAVAAITPGPNNFVVLSGSIRKWIRRTLPEYLGICLWFPFMVFTLSFLSSYVWIELLEKLTFIKYFGIAFLLYLAYKIFKSEKTDKNNISPVKETSFLEMFLFQWMNPKAWAMIMSTITLVWVEYLYLPAIIFSLVIFPAVWIWLLLWNFIWKQVLWTKYEIYINKTMAALLVCSVYFML